MGVYHEPRVPQGAPVDGERDAWFDGGKIKYGKWNASTNQWDVEREEDYQGETAYSAERLDGQLPSYFALATHTHEEGEPMADTWHKIGDSGEPVWQTGWAGLNGDVRFKKIGDRVYFSGAAVSSSFNQNYKTLFYLPAGYRPPDPVVFIQRTPNISDNTIWISADGGVRITGESTGASVFLYVSNFVFAI